MAAGIYANFYYVVNGYIQYSYVNYENGPFTLDDGVEGIVKIYFDGGNDYFHMVYDGQLSSDYIFFEDGSYLLTNQTFQEGTVIPNYAEDFGARSTTPYVACFLTGTRVATPQGERAVQDLAPGDLVLAVDGRPFAVKWVGRQSVASLFVPDQHAPVVISSGALGPNLPTRDLKLTSDHALLLDGVLVQAGALVNGTTIRRMPKAETGDRYTVFHIETECHEIILAEGCAAETFVDSVTRRRFDNYAEYEALFGGETETILELDLPRAMSARQLPDSIRALIEVRRAA